MDRARCLRVLVSRRWRDTWRVAALAAVAGCASAGARPVDPAIVRLDGTTIDSATLTNRIEELVRAADVQGLTVTVFNDAEVAYSRAFGVADQPAGRPLGTDTEIYGASLSKAVFAVLVMKLVEQGVVDLDTPLQRYLDEPLWMNQGDTWHEDLSALRDDSRYERITARMSLSHTTGLPNWRWFEPDHKLRIHFEPGARYSYSGEGMTLLQIVLERLTGKPLEQLMRENIFEPYGMRMSSYTWQPRFEADYALGHRADGSTYPKDKDNDARAPSTLETTTDDYARFMTAVLRGEGLGRASWEEIFRPQVRIRSRTQFGPGAIDETSANDAIQLSYGLGWGLIRTPHGWGAFKEGHGDGFQHYSIVFPERDLGVLLMSNSDNAESIFDHLLRVTIADEYTPLEWEGYVPYDRQPTAVRPGIEVFLADIPPALRGKRVGLITNHTGIDASRVSDIDLIAAHPDLELAALMAPEHGIRGNAPAGEQIVDEVDSKTGVPIYSLYMAEDRGPTPAMLKDVDVLVYDLQEVGGRTWTYVSTMALAMQAAAKKGIPFVVLDRPNPIGGEIVEGALLDPRFRSFVGMYPIPARHGMTVGELATLFNEQHGIGVDLIVARAENWRRSQWFDETGLPWVNPSPNLRSLAALTSYPGSVYFEGTTVTEGRGTDRPFEQVGASWLNAAEVVRVMNQMALPGIRFEAVTLTVAPTAAKFPGETIPGIRFVITDREAYRPVRTSLLLIDEIRRQHLDDFAWTGTIDRLTGSDKVRLAIEGGRLRELLDEWDREAAAFAESRKPFLLYP